MSAVHAYAAAPQREDEPARPTRLENVRAHGWTRMPTHNQDDGSLPWRTPVLAALLFFAGLFLYARASVAVEHDVAIRDSAGGSALATEAACAGPHGCRFLVPTIIGEQEFRAQRHLIQLARLAATLNRTLVLPNFATSRFTTCGAAAFDEIYDSATFAAHTGVKPILQGEFERWLASAPGRHSARAVRLRVLGGGELQEDTHGSLVRDTTLGGRPRAALCIDEGQLDFAAREPLLAVEPFAVTGSPLLENLRKLDAREGVEVFLMHYDLRAPLLGRASDDLLDAAFEYSEAWHALAEVVRTEVGEAVGVHWRTEGIEPQTLDACSASLVDVLVGVKEEMAHLRSVYLATDYPLELLPGAPSHVFREGEASAPGDDEWTPAHSDTLSAALTPAHHAALSHFLASFRTHAAPAGLHLRTYRSVLPSILPSLSPALAQLAQSPAAPAIVSQLVLRRTAFFLAGEPWRGGGEGRRVACARNSNWTKRVVRARQRAAAQKKGGKKTTGLWSTDGIVH